MGLMDSEIKHSDLGGNQQDQVSKALQIFISSMVQAMPQLGGHFLSGGTIQVLTLSGVNLKIGFEPQLGGIILPGGIVPR